MSASNILYSTQYKINEHISIEIPRVRDVLGINRDDDAGENAYYGMVATLVATPRDLMVQLDDIGIDFTELDDYELFIMLFGSLKEQDTSIIFGDLDLSRFDLTKNQENGEIILMNHESGATIDRAIHYQICQVIRKIHRLEHPKGKPANAAGKKYMIERARIKMKRRSGKSESSQLEELIIALVNTEQFNYKFHEVLDLSIYQFNESVHQIVKKINFDHTMSGIYSGTISASDIKDKHNKLNWLTNK